MISNNSPRNTTSNYGYFETGFCLNQFSGFSHYIREWLTENRCVWLSFDLYCRGSCAYRRILDVYFGVVESKNHVLRVLLEFLRFYFENRSSMKLNLCWPIFDLFYPLVVPKNGLVCNSDEPKSYDSENV